MKQKVVKILEKARAVFYDLYSMKHSDKPGFGILEVLIAGLIISMMLTALVSVGKMTTDSSRQMSEKTQAYYLAQDGIEQFRRARDSSWFNGTPGNNINSLTLAMAGSNVSSMSGYVQKNGNFVWDSAENEAETNFNLDGTIYRRRAEIEKISSIIPGDAIARDKNALRIKIIVYWNNNTKSVEVSELLTDWRPNY